jgi:valacyclovir hydrolase
MPTFDYDSHRIFYRLKGEGPLLLILPGNTASSASHQGELEYFSQTHQVAALDYLGTGKSDRLNDWLDDWFYQAACQAKALADHLSGEKCIVMGASGGSAAALLMAVHFPEKVAAVIADSCAEQYSPEALRMEVRARKNSPEELKEFWQHAHGDDWQEVVEADGDMLLRFAANGADCFKGRLGKVSCPVLFTASLQDSLIGDAADQICGMAVQIAGSRVCLYNAGDHPLMWTGPEEFRQAAKQFMDNLNL